MTERPADWLAGELMAVNAILIFVLRNLAASDGKLDQAIRAGLDQAADFAEHLTLAPTETSGSRKTAETLRVIENLRASIFQEQRPAK